MKGYNEFNFVDLTSLKNKPNYCFFHIKHSVNSIHVNAGKGVWPHFSDEETALEKSSWPRRVVLKGVKGVFLMMKRARTSKKVRREKMALWVGIPTDEESVQ